MKQVHLFLLFFLSFSLISVSSYGSHLMGGEITYTCLGNNTYAYQMTLYRDCNGVNLGSTAHIQFASASCSNSFTRIVNTPMPTVVTPLCTSEPDVCLGQAGATLGVEQYIYLDTVTLPVTGCNDWIISWSDCCRNGAITTVTSSNQNFYIESTINDATAMCNNSPTFHHEPIFYGCINDQINYSHGISDIDRDSLVFSLVDCQQNASTTVSYAAGFSGIIPFSSTNGVSIDASTGIISFTPNAVEVGIICVMIEEFRDGQKIGEYVRDIEMGIINCTTNGMPQLSGINGTIDANGSTGVSTLNTCLGSPLCFTIDSYDPDVTQQLTFSMSNSLAGASVSYSSGLTPQATICWSPTAADIGPNLFSIQVEDDHCPNVGENIYSYVINVTPDTNSAVITTPDTAILIGTSLQINTSSFDPATCSISWSPTVGLSCTDCPNPVATPTVPTTYWATIDCGGCAVTDTVWVVPHAASTTPVSSFSSLDLFPNPASDVVNLRYELEQKDFVDIQIFDITGRKVATVQSENQSAGQYQLNLQPYMKGKSGVYLIRVQTNNEVITKRLLYNK